MRNKTAQIMFVAATSLLLAVATCIAQSTDPNNPTPITSNVLTITGPKKVNQQFYYSLTAGTGQVTMAFNVKAKTSSTFVGVKVFDLEMNTLTYHNMSADTSSPGVAKKTFEVNEKQKIILSFTSDSSLASCSITFGGAVEFGEGASESGSAIVSEVTPQVATEVSPSTITDTSSSSAENGNKNKTFTMSILDAVGQRFNIPANGKLRIEMKDGSVQEIDLAQVKKILVKK